MSKTVRLNANKFDGYETKVELKGSISEYAMNFLKIFNNVKSRRDCLSIWNDYDNGVYVKWTDRDGHLDKETMEGFLSQFGEVKWTYPIVVYEVDDEKLDDYDLDKYWDVTVVASD